MCTRGPHTHTHRPVCVPGVHTHTHRPVCVPGVHTRIPVKSSSSSNVRHTRHRARLRMAFALIARVRMRARVVTLHTSSSSARDWKASVMMTTRSRAFARASETLAASNKRSTPRTTRTVMIVESPAKAKVIEKYLGDNARVLASYGHVRDLVNKRGSVRPREAFAMTWTSTTRQRGAMKDIADAVSEADVLLLATDPDREGEAISWHLLEVLKEKRLLRDDLDVKRVTFSEITKSAVLEAVNAPREINAPMVDAYMARRALDYLFGFTLSGLLWRKLPSSVSLSAGRVQSVALRLVCEREEEVEAFVSEPYWSINADMLTKNGAAFEAALARVDGVKLGKFTIASAAQAGEYARRVRECETLRVVDVKQSEAKRTSGPPFTTSTMQQEANKQLGFGASRTMSAAQRLYEGAGAGEGLITYMRTDGTYVAPYAIEEMRATAGELFGNEYVPESPRYFKKTQKNAQEAHEAIRPTSARRLPAQVARQLGPGSDESRLYGLIWSRAMASQMSPALTDRIAADIESTEGDLALKANGHRLTFPGYLAAYRSTKSDGDAPASDDAWLPELARDDALRVNRNGSNQGSAATEHKTMPPPRYTDGSIVKALEERGIGRPSTYAPILKVLAQREYVAKQGAALIPTTRGRLVSAFLTNYFPKYVDYGFTADLERKLDDVSSEQAAWKPLLSDWWVPFEGTVESLSTLRVSEVIDALDEKLGSHLFGETKYDGHVHVNKDEMVDGHQIDASKSIEHAKVTDARRCPSCKIGRLGLKPSKSGGFIGCSNYPTCGFTHPLQPLRGAIVSETDDPDFITPSEDSVLTMYPKTLGIDPVSGKEISLRMGPYGPYLQLGAQELAPEPEPAKDGKKPKKAKKPAAPRRVGVANIGKTANELTLEDAIGMFEYPKTIGAHPTTQSAITVNIGPFGYYVACDSVNASISKTVQKRIGELSNLTLEDAVEILRKKAERPARTRGRYAKKTTKVKAEPKAKKTKSKANTNVNENAEPDAATTEVKEKRKRTLKVNVEILEAAPSATTKVEEKKKPLKVKVEIPGLSKPLSAFFAFSKDERPSVVEAHPDYKVGAVAKVLGERWAALDPERKAKYEAAAKDEKEAYAKALAAFTDD